MKKNNLNNIKIYVKTFVLGANHGQYLQAYGLYKAIKSISQNFEIYHPLYNNHFFKEFFNHILSLSFLKYLTFIIFWFKRFEFKNKDFISDIEIYGSDMIWHNDSELFKFDKFYLKPNKLCKKVISYAPSVGRRNVEREPDNIDEFKFFKHLSVRDENTKNFVMKYSSKTPEVVCDPSLFLNLEKIRSKQLSKRFKKKVKNICTIYGNNKVFHPILENNQYFKSNLKIRPVGYFRKNQIINNLFQQFYDPLYVINSFSESKFILTTTFHGVMIALLTKRPFLAVADSNLIARLSNYEKYFSKHRIIDATNSELRNETVNLNNLINKKDIDYDGLNAYISDSYKWLFKSLKD